MYQFKIKSIVDHGHCSVITADTQENNSHLSLYVPHVGQPVPEESDTLYVLTGDELTSAQWSSTSEVARWQKAAADIQADRDSIHGELEKLRASMQQLSQEPLHLPDTAGHIASTDADTVRT